MRQEQVEVQLQQRHWLFGQVKTFAHLGMRFAQQCPRVAPARCNAAVRAGCRADATPAKAHAGDMQALQQRLDNAFEMRKAKCGGASPSYQEDGSTVPGQGNGQAPLLQGRSSPGCGQIDPTNLEQRHALAIAAIGAQGFQHAGQQAIGVKTRAPG